MAITGLERSHQQKNAHIALLLHQKNELSATKSMTVAA
jgi:hypothetical protein